MRSGTRPNTKVCAANLGPCWEISNTAGGNEWVLDLFSGNLGFAPAIVGYRKAIARRGRGVRHILLTCHLHAIPRQRE